MKRPPVSCAVFRAKRVVLHDIQAWVAVFIFHCNGVPYDYYFAIGLSALTEREAHGILENSNYEQQAHEMFLRDVVIPPTIH